MPRYRTIKPEHWNDKELLNITLQAQLLWIGTWNFSDDAGVFEDDPQLLRSQVFPRRKDVRLEEISKWLDQLVKARYIIPFTHNGGGYYITRSFKAHQRIDKPQPSKIPSDIIRGILQEHSKNDHGGLPPESRVGEGNIKEKRGEAPAPEFLGKKEGEIKFIPPDLLAVAEYFKRVMGDTKQPNHWPEDKCRLEATKMFNHYKANGWMQGKGEGRPIVDWEGAAGTWITKCIEGTFDKTPPVAKEKEPAARKVEAIGRRLNPVLEELNQMYAAWLEDPAKVTVISVTADHYNFLKKANMVAFTDEKAEEIIQKAQDHMKEKGYSGEAQQMRLMKSFGVLEFFKQLKAQGKETVSNDPNISK